MSISDERKNRAREALAVAGMSAERPLDALLPQLRATAIPRTAVHPRVLETKTATGREWLLLVWDDPGGPQALHEQIQALVEATLLAELSRSPATIRAAGDRRFEAIRLLSWAETPWDAAASLRAFGLEPDNTELTDEVVAAVTAEAERSGRTTTGRPASSWRATIRHPESGLGEKLSDVSRMMADRMGDDVWGQNPGGPSHLFATYLATTFGEKIRPDVDGLRALHLLTVQQERGVIRWMPPLVFQAICDFVPVVAATVYGAQIGWAVSEELGDGFAHPPLIRVNDGGDEIHIPIGHHVLRWWMMPLGEDEEVPTLAEWVEDQFGSGGAALHGG